LISSLPASKKIIHAKPQRREGAKDYLFAPSLLCETFFFCSRKGVEKQSRQGVLIFATFLLGESNFFSLNKEP